MVSEHIEIKKMDGFLSLYDECVQYMHCQHTFQYNQLVKVHV